MKIYNKKEEFTITFDNKEFFIPKGFSECNIDIFKHIQSKSLEWGLDVIDADSEIVLKKDVVSDNNEVFDTTEEEAEVELEELKLELDKEEKEETPVIEEVSKPKGKPGRPKAK